MHSANARSLSAPADGGLVETARAFIKSQALFVAVELGLFDAVEDGPSADQLITRLGVRPEQGQSLLLLLITLGMISQSADGTLRNSIAVRKYLLRGSPHCLVSYVRWKQKTFEFWCRALPVLRGETEHPCLYGKSLYDHLGRRRDDYRLFHEALEQIERPQVNQLVRQLRLSTGNRGELLDIGCGSGHITERLLRRFPEMRAVLIDRNLDLARERLQDLIREGRAELREADFTECAFPPCDIALFSHVLCDWPSEEALGLLGKAKASLRPGGRILAMEYLHPAGNACASTRARESAILGFLLSLETLGTVRDRGWWGAAFSMLSMAATIRYASGGAYCICGQLGA